MPWDLHAVSSGGGTALTAIGTILLGGDRATVAGVPPNANATLTYHGAMTTIADTILRYQLLSNAMRNPRQGFDFQPGASSLLGAVAFRHNLKSQLLRLQNMAQNTGAANNMGFTIDYYADSAPPVWRPTGDFSDVICDYNTFAALTAITWKDKAYVPTITLEPGKYAILGAVASALTNYGLLRFVHNDFKGYLPGFPVVDQSATAVANASLPKFLQALFPDGLQFVTMGECPVFGVTQDGAGLTIQAAAITADTPIVNVVLKKVG